MTTETDRTEKLERLIEKYEGLKKDLIPTEEELKAEIQKVKQKIIDRSRARVSFTGDPLKDLSIFTFGSEYKDNYNQLLQLKDILKKAEGEFLLIHDTSFNLMINVMKESDRCYIPFRVAALGIIDKDPLDVGYEHDITGDKYYIKLRFREGSYIRELEVKELPTLDKWLKVLPTFRGKGGGYTETTEPLKLILPEKDYHASEEYIRHVYVDYQEPQELSEQVKQDKKSKKPYWRITPNRFDVAEIEIGTGSEIEIYEEQEFPKKIYKDFALYIGNGPVMKRTGIELKESSTLQDIYSLLNSGTDKAENKTLIF
jgi:hypothetical protein